MTLEKREITVCQSCGLPLKDSNLQGTNSDGTRSEDYCNFCFRSGAFTMPGITMERMIDKVANVMSMKLNMAFAESRQIAARNIPRLARWRS